MDVSDHKIQQEVVVEFSRLKTLFGTGLIQEPRNFRNNPFYVSVLIDILIQMNDLLQKVRGINRIDFSNDIPQNGEYTEKNIPVEDITCLIRFFRNAACHIDNDKRNLNASNAVVSFGMFVGSGVFINNISSPYDDDAMIVSGHHKLYIKRHLVRAWKELQDVYLDIPEFNPILSSVLS